MNISDLNLSSNHIPTNVEDKHVTILPPQGFSRAKDILPLLPFSSTTLWEWSRDGKRFPKPYRISPTITAWKNSEVLEWLDNQASISNKSMEVK